MPVSKSTFMVKEGRVSVLKQTRLEKTAVKLTALKQARSTEHNIPGGGTLMGQELPWESTVVKSSVTSPNVSGEGKGVKKKITVLGEL